MLVSLNPSALRQTRWYEYAVRFFFGGAVTVVAGLIAKKYGPTLGGPIPGVSRYLSGQRDAGGKT